MRMLPMRALAAAMLAAPLAAQDAPPQFEATRTVPLTQGQWSYLPSPGGSEARFGTSFAIRCDRAARRVTLRRIEPIVSMPVTPMTITTDLGVRTLPIDGVLPNIDRVLDAIAFSRGRFLVTGGGGASRLIIPASPEAARSIEDCRI